MEHHCVVTLYSNKENNAGIESIGQFTNLILKFLDGFIRSSVVCIKPFSGNLILADKEGKAVPIHAMEALGLRARVALTHS
jgi:hypothetical protein